MVTTELLLHPVRLRVVQALLGDRVLTTGDLHAELPDVPTASLYRHVAVLAGAGMLEVVDEHKVRGAVERRYRLVPGAVSLGPERMGSLDADEHRRAFAVFATGLLADYDRYLERAGEQPDLGADGVSYRQLALWLADDEVPEFLREVREVLQRYAEAGPGEGRRRRVLTTVLLPAG
jgi:DNA-binding transcriptional ArsR family regulator